MKVARAVPKNQGPFPQAMAGGAQALAFCELGVPRRHQSMPAQGVFRQSHVGGDPVNGVDPDGLNCVSANGSTTCHYPNGPSFTIPTPPGFPSSIGPSNFLYHSYDVSVSTTCSDAAMTQALIDDPAPGSPMSPASSKGTPNVAQAFGIHNPIISYSTHDLKTGLPLIVNVTNGTGGFAPGYVAREVSRGVVNNYGEGLAPWQSPLMFSPQFLFDQLVWRTQTNSLSKSCGCR